MPVNRRLHSLGMVVASAAIVAQPIVLTTAAQAAAKPDCSLAMQSPSPDSISLLVLLEAHAFDREHDIPDWYQAEFADAVRASLVIPNPLAIDSYVSDKNRQPNTAHQSLPTRSPAGRLPNWRQTIFQRQKERGIMFCDR